jgi:hypothetical protein
MTDTLARLFGWARTVLGSLPAILAYLVALFTVLAVEVVPLLPDPWALRLGGWLATALATVAAVQSIVSRVMRVPAALEGTTIPDPVNNVTWEATDGGRLMYTSPRGLSAASTGNVTVTR